MGQPRGPADQIGYVDESYGRDSAGRLIYVLGLVDVVSSRLDELAAALRDLPRSRGGHLHFSSESPERRIAVAEKISALDLRLTAVVRRSTDRAERARGLGVRDLGWAVRGRLSELVFESRNPKENEHDASVLGGLQPQGVLLPCSFAGKGDQPLLWVADFVAGAVRLELTGGSGEARRALGGIELHEG